MVLDADARRARAVNRLARWAGFQAWEERWFGGPLALPVAVFAANRRAAAERHVEWVAGRDVAAGRLDPDVDVDLAAHRVPGDLDDRRTGHYLDAAAAYNRAAVRAATALIDAAAADHDDHPAPEGLRGQPDSAALRRDHHDDPGR